MPGDRCPHLPTLLFATHDGKEYGMLPVGRPVDPATLNQTPDHTRQILRDVLAGMDWLHERCWLHRDIRWDNIVLDSDGRAVLVDLGGATMLNEVCGEYMGGWICVPPQLLAENAMHQPYVPKVSDDYHAMVLLVNTLLFPYSQRGFNSGNIGFSTSVVALDASPLCRDEFGVLDAPGVIRDRVDGPDAGGETSDDDDESLHALLQSLAETALDGPD
ncbi:hypothetical protein FN846DRAFT_905157 [Sphaerosporella brunnea]|uniref:Protein kinase domain-containing protein n=1 Tax=Sphaerosporella brunnea TaxID=1250544 RepID=A0A5J5F2Y5_9PEZI|nr:hypothetical protein FN846DRAFT_905157 [Sphaerosporella brunnea]